VGKLAFFAVLALTMLLKRPAHLGFVAGARLLLLLLLLLLLVVGVVVIGQLATAAVGR